MRSELLVSLFTIWGNRRIVRFSNSPGLTQIEGVRARIWTKSDLRAHILQLLQPTHYNAIIPTRELRVSKSESGSVEALPIAFNKYQDMIENLTFWHTTQNLRALASLCFLNPCTYLSLSLSLLPPSFESGFESPDQYQWCHYSSSLTNRSVSGNMCFPFSTSPIFHQIMNASILMFLFPIKKELLFFNEEKN